MRSYFLCHNLIFLVEHDRIYNQTENQLRLSVSHTYTTHGPRTENLVILASALSFAKCASAFVTHSSSALNQRYAFVIIR